MAKIYDKHGREIILRDYDAKEIVGVQIGHEGHKLWVCIDGVAVLRIKSPKIELEDMRSSIYIGYHVTTEKQMNKYVSTGCILSPVRFWPNLETAKNWMNKTERKILLKIFIEGNHYPLIDHKPARWTDSLVRKWEILYG